MNSQGEVVSLNKSMGSTFGMTGRLNAAPTIRDNSTIEVNLPNSLTE
jgi:hypothetical protein